MATYTYRVRIRNSADSADALTVTSVAGGTNPYISEPPSGDGQGFDPRSGQTEVGSYSVRIADNGSTASAVTGFLADAFSRYDKLGRRAYLEYGTDGTTFPNLLVAGYVTDISFPSAAEAQITVGEAQRSENTKLAFTTATTGFPATTMLAGGPIRTPATFSAQVGTDFGPWTVRVETNDTSDHIVVLQFVSGYVLKSETAVDYTLVSDSAFPAYMKTRLNALAANEVNGGNVGTGSLSFYQRFGNVFADIYSAGVLVTTVQVLGFFAQAANGASTWITDHGYFAVEWTSAAAFNDRYQVYVYTRSISESSPLHLYQHPVDLITGLITEAGDSYDATTAATVKASVGADVRVFLRLTESHTIKEFIDMLLGVFGLGRRVNSSNAWAFFDQRAKTTSAPSNTITLAKLRDVPSDIWSLGSGSIVNNLTVTVLRFARWALGSSGTRTADSLIPVEQKRTARLQLSDGTYPDATIGVHEVSYSLPGTIVNVNAGEVDLTQFTTGLAATAFDRWGGGAPRTTLACRETVTDQVGDEVLLDLNFLPTVNTRGSQRIVQIVRRTNEPGGPVLVVEDAGSSAQPAVSPTFTVTANAVNVSTQADVTLTNAAALVASGVVSVLVEWAVSVLAPVVAGQDLGAIIPATPVVLTTPPCAGGLKVWARAKSIQPTKRAGTFTSWAGVTLTGVSAPGSLAFTANALDGSTGTLAWTAGAGASSYAVRVLLRLSALSAASDLRHADLLAGSTGAPLSGLTPSASYTATVQYVDPASDIVAASATVTFSAGATVYVLGQPSEPVGVVGRTDADGVGIVDGTYGLDVTATEIPGTVEFFEAIETGLASGYYGTPVSTYVAASASGGRTGYRLVAPRNGLRRRLTARHVRTGVTSSGYTSAQVVDPWGAVQSPDWNAAALPVWDWSDTSTTRTFTWTRTTNCDAVWVYDTLVAVGGGSGWPASGAFPSATLVRGTDTYAASIPAAGYQRFIQFEPRTDRGVVGPIRRSVVDATPVGLLYNQCIATVTATTATTVDVTVTATGSGVTPTVQFVSVTGSGTLLSGPAAGVAAPSGTVWVFTRGAALGGTGQARFRAVVTGYVDDDDLVSIPEQGRDTVYLASRARVTATTATTVTVRYAVADPYPQGANTATITYQDQGSGGVTPASGGTVTPAATLTEAINTYIEYTVTRPAFGTGAGRVTFTATAANRTSDSDAVDVPEADRDTVYLASRARVTATTATTVTVRYAVADPYPQGAASATITYQDQGSGGVTPASGGTVTPAATLTEAINTYIEYTVTRPAFGVGAGRVTFTATAANRTSDSDAVDVPEADRDTVSLLLGATQIASTTTTVDVQLTATDPLGTATMTITLTDAGSPAIVNSALGSNQWRLTRPAWNTAPSRVEFTATATSRASAKVSVTVPPQTSQSTTKKLMFSGLGLTPATSNESFIKSYGSPQGYASNGTGGVSCFLIREVMLADGVTITGFESVTFRSGVGESAVVHFTKQDRSTRVTALLVTHVNNTTGATQTLTTTGLSETVDNALYVYFVDVFLTGAAIQNARVYDYGVYITSNDLSQA